MYVEKNTKIKKNRPPIYKHLPQLSLAERDRRWDLVKNKMRVENIDCLLVFGDEFIRYLTHVPTNTLCALFPLEGEPIVYYNMRAFDCYWDYGIGQNWVKDCRPQSFKNQLEDVSRELKNNAGNWKRIGVAIANFTRPLWATQFNIDREFLLGAMKVRGVLPDADWVDVTQILQDATMINSPEEISLLEKAAELAELMFEAMCEKSGTPGTKECEVYSAMLSASLDNGGDIDMIMLDSGNPVLMHPKGTAQYCATTRVLKPGDMVTTEYHATYAGYKIAKEHTISLGEPDKRYQEIFDLCVECHDSGLKKMRPGELVDDAAKAFIAPVEEAGLSYIENGICGHGLFSCVHPKTIQTSEYLEKSYRPPLPTGVKFEEGMVFGSIVDIYDQDWLESTVMLGDTYVIEKNGPRKLTKIPFELTVM